MNRIARTVHRPVRVHVGGQRACCIRAHPVGPGRADREIIFGPSHDLYVFRARLFHINLGKAVQIRGLLAGLIAIYKEEGFCLSRRLTRLPIRRKCENRAWRGFGDQGHLADDHDRVGAQLAVRGLDQINAAIFDGNGNILRFPPITA